MKVEMLTAYLVYSPTSLSMARPIDKAKAADIAESIRQVGLLSPLIVRPGRRVRNGQWAAAWEILAGNHRYEAMFRILNWAEIPCHVVEVDDLHAELVTIDENLKRSELSDALRAYQTGRRKEIYEALHPETKQGGAPGAPGGGKQKREDGQIGHSRFTAATAKATGKGERTVRREAERGEKLGTTLTRIAGTSLDKGVEIDALAALPHQEREKLVVRAEKGERVSARKAEPPQNLVVIDTEGMKAATAARRVMREYLELSRGAQALFDGLYQEVRAESAKDART